MEPSTLYRRPVHLSPSSISTFRQNPDEYYLRYLCHHRSPRFPQTQPMSIGSAFDAYCKSDLNQKLFGNKRNPKFDFDALFTAQVEPQNRDWAKKHGKIVYDLYVESGSFADLLVELEGALRPPKLETEIYGIIQGSREGITSIIGGVPFLGKMDIHFISKAGASVILDWKVNGYLSLNGVSPAPGYVKLREKGKSSKSHPDCQFGYHKNVLINIAKKLNQVNGDWADQLCIYAWLCGEEIGSQFIAAIDQVVCRPNNIRFAQHRSLIDSDYQFRTFAEAQRIWEISQSDHIFRELSIEESKKRCELLDQQARGLTNPNKSTEDKVFDELTRFAN